MVNLSQSPESDEKKVKSSDTFHFDLDVFLNVVESERRLRTLYDDLTGLKVQIQGISSDHPDIIDRNKKNSAVSPEKQKIIDEFFQLVNQIVILLCDIKSEENYHDTLVSQIGESNLAKFSQEFDLNLVQEYMILCHIDGKNVLLGLKCVPHCRNIPVGWKQLSTYYPEIYYKFKKIRFLKRYYEFHPWDAECKATIFKKKCETCDRVFYTQRKTKKRCSDDCKNRFFNEKRLRNKMNKDP